MRQLFRLRNSFRLELLRELPEPVRGGAFHRRRSRDRRRSHHPSSAGGFVGGDVDVDGGSRLDASEDDGVVVLEIDRDLDELFAVTAVGAFGSGGSGCTSDGESSGGNGIERPPATIVLGEGPH